MNQHNRSIYLISVICIFAAGILGAQEQQEVTAGGMRPEIRRRSLILDINARVLESENVVSWSEADRKTTISGSPVGIRLDGSNVVVSVQFTPYVRRHGNMLVAQVQIWFNDPSHGVNYHTSIQTIPFGFNEPIYFFPLGQPQDSSSIEIIITVNPFREPASPDTAAGANNDE